MVVLRNETWHWLITDIVNRLIDSESEIKTYSPCNGITGNGLPILVTAITTVKQGAVVIYINTLKPRQNGRHFADNIFKCIFLNENVSISTKISLKFLHKRSINNIPALVQIMALRRPGDKPLSQPMMVNLPMHICVTRPQWVNKYFLGSSHFCVLLWLH